jgi:hypothetical protein
VPDDTDTIETMLGNNMIHFQNAFYISSFNGTHLKYAMLNVNRIMLWWFNKAAQTFSLKKSPLPIERSIAEDGLRGLQVSILLKLLNFQKHRVKNMLAVGSLHILPRIHESQQFY